jgi:hypothetical protein
MVVGEFNTCLSPVDRSTTKKESSKLNNTADQMDLKVIS